MSKECKICSSTKPINQFGFTQCCGKKICIECINIWKRNHSVCVYCRSQKPEYLILSILKQQDSDTDESDTIQPIQTINQLFEVIHPSIILSTLNQRIIHLEYFGDKVILFESELNAASVELNCKCSKKCKHLKCSCEPHRKIMDSYLNLVYYLDMYRTELQDLLNLIANKSNYISAFENNSKYDDIVNTLFNIIEIKNKTYKLSSDQNATLITITNAIPLF